jgi:predicted Ser/Thr protein kinase
VENEPTLADGVAGRARADDHIGRFSVLRKLGEGGMGVVYEAHDPQLDRHVALKLVRVDSDPQSRARLFREAQAMAKVAHPNVVPIYEVGDHHGQVFVAMELVPGETLQAWVTRDKRPWRDALAMYVAAGRGLAAAHATGIVHRDFKPDNVLVGGDGRPRVLDFGLARGIHQAGDDAPATSSGNVLDLDLTVAGSMMGTPGFMSPEHFRGEGIGPASDQFGFAVAVYRALYGEMPFAGKTVAELRDVVCAGAPKPPRGDPDLPAAVTAAVLRALATDPAERFPSLDALLAELDRPLRVDPDRDVLRGRAARKVVAGAIGVAALTGIVVGGATGLSMTPAWALVQGAVALAIILVLGAAARRSLAASAHNRRVGVLIAATCLALVVHRALALYLGAPALDTLVGDGVMVALATTLAGVTLERWMLGGAVLALIYVGFAIVIPSDAGMGFGGLMLTYAAIAAWRWSR